MTKAESKDLQKKNDTSLMGTGQKRGMEEAPREGELEIPRAKLLQALSPEITDGLEGVRPGIIVNSLTKEALPAEFVPVFKFTNWIRFNPRSKDDPAFDQAFGPGEVIWRSSDPEDPRVIAESVFGPNGERPKAVTFMNFFAYFPGVPMPVVVSFSRTSYKAGRHLLSLVRFSEGDMFSWRYKLGAKQVKNDMGTYFVLTVDKSSRASEPEFGLCEKLWKEFSLRKADIKVHGEEEQDPESQTETEGKPWEK